VIVATVGQQLTTPEPGWRRYDNSDFRFNYSGFNVDGSDSECYLGTFAGAVSSQSPTIDFSFVGSKIRIIAMVAATYATSVGISIDGVEETFSTYKSTSQRQTLVYEKTGLEFKEHIVHIRTIQANSNVATYDYRFDAVDIDSIGYLPPVVVGDQLNGPELGWKRYDDTNSAIKYNGIFTINSKSGPYNNTEHLGTNNASFIEFDFIGTKLRIIQARWSDYSQQVSITIDGNTETYSENGSNQYQTLVYEKMNLPYSRHKVILKKIPNDTAYWGLDAIDIDDTGRLLHPDEVTDPKEIIIGKRIRCNYKATSKNMGVFSNLGKETSDFIPAASTASSNGDFYLICVDNGRRPANLKMIADRNIQNNISWDTLNSYGIASGSGLPQNFVLDTLGQSYYQENRIDLQIIDNITINSKFLLRSYSTSTVKYIYLCAAYGDTEVTNALYGIYVNPNGFLAMFHETGAGTNIEALSTYRVPLNTIIDVTISRNTATKVYSLWVNNVYQGDFSYSSNPTKGTSPTQKLYIGADVTYNSDITKNLTNMILYNFSIDAYYIDNTQYNIYARTKYQEGKLYNLNPLNKNEYDVIVRLPTGGISTSDTDNEWNQYVVNSNLNGTITPGDNNVWNWSGIASWSSSTVDGTPANRSTRGNSSVTGFYSVASSTVGTGSGFRPVFLIEFYPIFDGSLDHSSVNREDVILSGIITDPSGSNIRYKITVNGIQEYPDSGFTNLEPSPITVEYTILNDNLIIGQNTITLTIENEEGFSSTYNFQVNKINTPPSINSSMVGMKLTVNISDNNGDAFQYKIVLNGNKIFPEGVQDFTELQTGSAEYFKIFKSNEINIGQNNQVLIIAQDEFGESSSQTINFIGDYSNLIFVDPTSNIAYSDDRGNVLNYLSFGNVNSGETSNIQKVRIVNKNPNKLGNIRVFVDSNASNTYLLLSKTDSPFEAATELLFDEQLEYSQYVEFYVKVVAGANDYGNIINTINLEAFPV
jgi:hypothetical protein